MIAICCIDSNGGMMFNKRRQSRDKAVIQKISEITEKSVLHMNSYSKILFGECNFENIRISDGFLEEAKDGEYCFLENENLTPYKDKLEKIIIFNWNRHYPADVFFDIASDEWKLSFSEEFSGNSHEKITMEIYEK